MKKILSVFLALLMMFTLASVGTVAFAEDTAPAAEESTTSNARGPVSGYDEFNYACDYCGETHSGFFGVFIAMIHTALSAVKLMVTAVKR